MWLGLRTVIYPAPDLRAAAQWYTQVLGQPPAFDVSFYVGFSVGGFELGLLPGATPGVSGSQLLWGVDNVDDEVRRLLALGALPLEPATDVGGGIRVAAVQDPFGNRIGLVFNPHFNPAGVR